MNLEQVYMFDGCLFYDPSSFYLYEPLKQFLQIDNLEQFMGAFGEPAQREPLMSIDKKSRIATIPISGPLMPKQNFMLDLVGGTSTNEIRQAVRQASEDKGIKGILLKTNSPGGSAAGIDETAMEIAELSSKKPVFTHVAGSNGSAAYYLTSQSNRIFANNRTDQIGSIGTKLVMNDTSKAAEMAGVKPIVIATGANKSIGAPGVKITQGQQDLIASMVKDLQGFFEESVKRKRPNVNMSEVNDGRTFFAKVAKSNGLIDDIRTERDVRAMLKASMR